MTDDRLLRQLNLRRWFPAPRDLVFRAFTEADLLERWFSPSPDTTLKVTHLDARVGGRYRFVYAFPGETVAVVVGEYRRLMRPNHLAFT